VRAGVQAWETAYDNAQQPCHSSQRPDYKLSYTTVTSKTRYLGPLTIPDTTKLVGLKAPKGSGKTQSIADLVHTATRNGQRVWVITYREQLGIQLARRLGLPYKTEVGRSQEGPLLGYVLCIDSLHPGAEIPFTASGTQDDLVILDECESVLWHLLNSATCTKQRVAILKQFTSLLQGVLHPESKGRVILADAELSDLSINCIKGLAGQPDLTPYVVLNTYKPPQGWTIFSYTAAPDLLTAMKTAIAAGGKHLILTTGQKTQSKWGTQTLETDLQKTCPEKTILRLDSQTIADPSHPAFGCLGGDLSTFIAGYDIVIASPTLESGVSLDLYGHFAAVWGFFTGTLPENSVRQFIARLRDNQVPRHLYVAERGLNTAFIGNGATAAQRLQEGETQKAVLNRQALTDAGITFDEQGNISFNSHPLEAWGKLGARINQGLANYRETILAALETEGHTIHHGTVLDKEERQTINDAISTVRNENQQLEADAIASALPPETDTEYEALKLKRTKTAAERYAQRHFELKQLYAVPVTPERVLQDAEGWLPKIQLQYYLTSGADFLSARDQKRFTAIADSAGVAFNPDVNKKMLGVKVRTLQALGVARLLVEGVEFSNHHPAVRDIFEKLRQFKQAVKDSLGFTVRDSAESRMGSFKTCYGPLWGWP
jgi:hypothetical protein